MYYTPETDRVQLTQFVSFFDYRCSAYWQIAWHSPVNLVCYRSPVERLGSVFLLLPGSGMPVNTTPESRAAALKNVDGDDIQGT